MCLFFFSCSNNEDNIKKYKSEGIIVGLDWGACACCGGYIIEIDDFSYRLFDDFPPDSNLNLENLPLKVRLDWELKTAACNNFITISAIEIID